MPQVSACPFRQLHLEGTGSAVLTTRAPAVEVGGHPASLQALEFLVLGAEHLVTGLDHVLFLLALLIGARRPRDVVVTASAFTAAHSITFLLAAMGIVEVPARVVEPVVAVSITVVAVANLFGRAEGGAGRWRLPVVFAFGLVHGLGFAGALDIGGSGSWELLLSLLSFDLGIEVTQPAIVAVLFPLLRWLRRSPAHRWAVAAPTVPIVTVSLYWLVDRLPLPL
ncbi:HupE/UreJ family protein [Nonomuraea pusilla]|uniref:HupE / UreJ protein n=1 Tax=Nonomuraea pusilla TaxID=46177 RepID=A0A1H7IKH9_9ACTN|nr:HupE/UreJ family protein [Nonomuraea pusilla]SEK62976.1 HupE / UreJ protein [Nonomuraea pusilla]